MDVKRVPWTSFQRIKLPPHYCCVWPIYIRPRTQELEAKLGPADGQKSDLAVMMKALEALLARVG